MGTHIRNQLEGICKIKNPFFTVSIRLWAPGLTRICVCSSSLSSHYYHCLHSLTTSGVHTGTGQWAVYIIDSPAVHCNLYL